MSKEQSNTTVGAAVAGAALGGVVGWIITATTGVDTAPVVGGFSTLGAFAFGLIFPGR